jgi:5-methylcytosine-specific restriction enzyme subunit McrC
MNVVFEWFIRVALLERLRLDDRTFPPAVRGHAVHLDVEHQVPLEPDLSWWVAGRCVFVGDCKYKRTTGSVPNADAYQMLAYLTALQLDEGLLIYAAGEEIPHDVSVQYANKRIQIRIIDVTRPPADALAQIGELAEDISRIAARTMRSIRELAS